jgi:hypothetical protein
MTDQDLLAVVWGETSDLVPRDGTARAAARLYAVITHLADAARMRGMLEQFSALEPPRLGAPDANDYVTMNKTARDVLNNNYGGDPLPSRAALVEITDTGARKADGPLPVQLAWISSAASSGDFITSDDADKRIFRLYESPNAGRGNDLPFVSDYTQTGMPAPVNQHRLVGLAWTIGVLGTISFLLGLVMSAWAGHQVGHARVVLTDTTPVVQNALITAIGVTCIMSARESPMTKKPDLCAKVAATDKPGSVTWDQKVLKWIDPAKARDVLVDAQACRTDSKHDGCNIIWRAALILWNNEALHNTLIRVLSVVPAFLTGTDADVGKISIFVFYLMLVSGIGALIIALGLGTKQRVAGVWIDTRNRVSLARMQVTLWTVVALSGFAVLAFFNIGMIDVDNFSGYKLFPSIPDAVSAALGISIVSPMLSTLILPTKDASGKPIDIDVRGSVSGLDKRGVPFFGQQSDGLQTNPSSADASITDIFMGEEKANASVVDVSRLQNVVITFILVISYFWMLLELTSNIGIMQLLSSDKAFFSSMPNLGENFSWLLLVSHSTYLVSKSHDSQNLRS